MIRNFFCERKRAPILKLFYSLRGRLHFFSFSSSFLGRTALLAMAGLFAAAGMARAQQVEATSVPEAIAENNVLTLPEAINVALANNSDVKRSLLSLESADQ